jgi:hypothetical protein
MDTAALQTLRDRQAVIDTLLRLAQAFDEQDWPAARACLADELETDYSSFRGTPPQRLAAEAFVALRTEGEPTLHGAHRAVP